MTSYKSITRTFLKRAKQLRLPFKSVEMIPANIVVIDTADLDLFTETGIEECVRQMLAVPLNKSILLDYLVGYRPGDPHPSEEHAELHRLQSLLNSRYHGQRFDFLGNNLAAHLLRECIRTEGWNPFKVRR